MARSFSIITRLFSSVILGLMLFGLPLHAQLDPRLQGSTTDFLDLFQQSSQSKVKPEILTVFDFSGSMSSLMNHPLYVNNDASDSDDYRNMSFALTGAGGGVLSDNRYTIRATPGNCSGAAATYIVQVGSTGNVSYISQTNPAGCAAVSTAPTYTIKAKAAGNTTALATIICKPDSASTPHTNYGLTPSTSGTKGSGSSAYSVTATLTPDTGPYAAGSTVTLIATLVHPYTESSPGSEQQITWSIDNGGTLTPAVWSQVSIGVYQSVTTWKVYDFVATAGDPTQLRPITISPSLPHTTGSPLIFNTYFLTKGSGTNSDKINWTITGPSPQNCTWVAPASFQTTANTSSGGNFTWTPPGYCGVLTGGTDPYVTATLDPKVGASAVPGITYLTSSLTSRILIKPDGSPVTKADADLATSDTTSGLYGTSFGAGDVRNWVRMASHVRFKYGTRTIDIPLPWKITDRNSDFTKHPLGSVTVHDEKIVGVKTYGSRADIELDKNYLVSAGSKVLTGDSTKQTSTVLGKDTANNINIMAYRPAYISWLFNGVYQDGTYKNKYIVYDSANATLAGGQGNVTWGQGYGPSSGNWGTTIQVPQYSAVTGAYIKEVAADARVNIIPALTRCQAVKSAAIRTWINHQHDVTWAFRFLDVAESGNGNSAGSIVTTIDNDSRNSIGSGDPTASQMFGRDSGWKLLNNTDSITSTTGNSVTGMTRIASLFPGNGTPLTYAMARGLAQFNDPNSVFNDAYNADNPVSQCLSHFLIIFTDGADNNNSNNLNSKGSSPYITAANPPAIDANAGNAAIIANKGRVDRYGDNWNMFTFAGLGAHMANASLTSFMAAPVNTGTSASAAASPQSFLPFGIYKRNGTIFDRNHRITTMTVGVSLGGTYQDATSPKKNLFLTAAAGDASMPAWSDISTLTPFVLDPTANSGAGGKASGSLYFFDAGDPDSLSKNLEYAIISALGASLINVTSNPNLPFIGSSLGKQIYMGKFLPPSGGGVLWTGDLLMFPTTIDSTSKTVILDKTGRATTTFDATTAVWSTAKALINNHRWDARSLYTRLPGSNILTTFSNTGASYTNDATATPPGLKNYVAIEYDALSSKWVPKTGYPAGGPAQENLVKMVMGANLLNPSSTTNSEANRTNIMGDIINSSPAYLEYKWSEVRSRFPATSALQTADRNRFRLILVGDNQGWLHAFGEATAINPVALDATKPLETVDLVTGEVDELWAFMPTDFLANLDYLNTSTNAHKFMVDGSPTIYFLDLPSSAGGTGNGVLDGSNVTISDYLTDSTHERAIAIIGLRKGGRSYYAINLHDPFSPKLQWSLIPDEAASIPSSRNKTGLSDPALQTIVANMGYSTSTPSLGRILYGGVYKDVVFFGGGLSVPEIEAKFTGVPKLGRSILALEVNTGNILAAVDLTSNSIGGKTIGPISAGLVPFEFFLGSGMTQRAYFTDMWGGLWCWGSKQVVASATSSYNKFRMDTSDLKNWTYNGAVGTALANTGVRKVYQDANAVATTSALGVTSFSGPLYTTLPAPFLVNSFPGKGFADGATITAIPAAVGIAMVSGNRNDPLDFSSNKPANTRLTVVFDRQDSRAWGLDTDSGPDDGIKSNTKLLDAGKWGVDGAISTTLAYGDASITPGTSYYLAPAAATDTKFGYYVTFPDKQQDSKVSTLYHYSKGINTPTVVAGSAYYSYFTPTTADVCTGGSGFTFSNLICDVMNPVVSETVDRKSKLTCASGNVDKWVNVASDFSMLGAPGVQQAGTRAKVSSTDPSKVITYMDTNTYLGKGQERYPKARVWRTVR